MVNVENNNLQAIIDSVSTGETIVLMNDIVLTSKVSISKELTLDLNGYVISGDVDDIYGLIYVGTKGALTIINSSEKQTGGITNTVSHAIGNYGIVTIYGGTFTGNYALYNFYGGGVYGTSTIYGGIFKGVEGLAIANSGDLTVSGGVIESIDTTNVLSVTGGSVESLNIGVADYAPETQSTSVEGGTITALTVAEGSTNEIVVSGGTFLCEVNSNYLADGFKIVYDANTGSCNVVVDNSLKVVATSSARVGQLPVKNGQLAFVQDTKQIAFDFNNQRVFYNPVDEAVTEANKYTDDTVASAIEDAMTIIEF